jgi:hypothetical protein
MENLLDLNSLEWQAAFDSNEAKGFNEVGMFIKEGSAKRWISKWL